MHFFPFPDQEISGNTWKHREIPGIFSATLMWNAVAGHRFALARHVSPDESADMSAHSKIEPRPHSALLRGLRHHPSSILHHRPASPGSSPSFKAFKGVLRRTFGLFWSALFVVRVLSTTCIAKNALPTRVDSNGTEFWCGTPRHHPICGIRREENQTSPHAHHASGNISFPPLPADKRG